MEPQEEAPVTRTSSLSAEAMIGLGITIGATGILLLLLGWAQYMREAHDAVWILLPLGAVFLAVGLVAMAMARSRRSP